MNALPDWLIESGWQAAVMAVIISLVVLAGCGRIPPKWRYALLLLIVLRLLLPALPEARMSAYRVLPASPVQAWEAALPSQPTPVWLEPRGGTSAPISPTSEVDWRTGLGWLWLGGGLGFGAWLIARQMWFLRQYRRTRQRPSAALRGILASAAERAYLRRAPELWVMPGINGAALSGLVRPVIVVPPKLEGMLNSERMELVLLHECVHLRRADLWTHAAAVLAGVIHWWNPVVWWLRGRLMAERELATDAAVLACLAEPEQRLYGETLLELALHSPRGIAVLQPSLGLLEKHGNLRRRMMQIASFSRATMIWSIAGVVLLIGLAVVLLVRQAEPRINLSPQDQITLGPTFSEVVNQGDLRKVKDLVRRGIKVSDGNFTNALFCAIHRKDLPMVRYLVTLGGPMNERRTSLGDTAADHACWVGDKVILDTLIAGGAICDPYFYAIGTGDIAALEKRQAEKPLTKNDLEIGMCMATAANAVSNDWFWARLSPQMTPAERADWLNARFVNTAFWGRVDMMQDVEKMGADFQKNFAQALSTASGGNRLEMIKYLMSREGPSAKSSGDLQNSLRNAAGEGQVELVKIFLDRGADINAQDRQGLTPLSWAVCNRRAEVCRLLIDRGADLSLKDQWGGTALGKAAFGGNQPEVVEMLLRHGADPHEVDKSGAPILSAMQGFYLPRKGERGFPGKVYTEDEVKELQISLRKTVDLLVGAGADPNAPGGFDGTPLITAIAEGQSAIAKALIEHGADLNQRDEKGNTPISFFFDDQQGAGVDASLLQLLLDRGADPKSTYTATRVTPAQQPTSLLDQAVYMAVGQQGQPELLEQTRRSIEMLLQHGAKFSIKGNEQESAWIAAAALGDVARLKQLRAAGVDLNSKVESSYGRHWSALSVALALGRNEAADWLMQQGITPTPEGAAWSPFDIVIKKQDLALVRKFLAAGVKPTAGDMGVAANTGNTELFVLLQQAGGDASHLHLRYVIEQGYLDILKLALDSGAASHQTSTLTQNGVPENTDPVYWAVSSNQTECLKLLLQYGLPVNLKDATGETPLSHAQKWHSSFLPMLEEASMRTTPTPPSGA